MKTLKIMGIIGLVWAGLCFLGLAANDNPFTYEAGIGWGVWAVIYSIAYSIVGIVQSNRNK